jgi:hypothetical protein
MVEMAGPRNTRGKADLARTHLLYGQGLRRAKRRRDARQELRIAHDMFAAMGVDRFAERSAAELVSASPDCRGAVTQERLSAAAR